MRRLTRPSRLTWWWQAMGCVPTSPQVSYRYRYSISHISTSIPLSVCRSDVLQNIWIQPVSIYSSDKCNWYCVHQLDRISRAVLMLFIVTQSWCMNWISSPARSGKKDNIELKYNETWIHDCEWKVIVQETSCPYVSECECMNIIWVWINPT